MGQRGRGRVAARDLQGSGDRKNRVGLSTAVVVLACFTRRSRGGHDEGLLTAWGGSGKTMPDLGQHGRAEALVRGRSRGDGARGGGRRWDDARQARENGRIRRAGCQIQAPRELRTRVEADQRGGEFLSMATEEREDREKENPRKE